MLVNKFEISEGSTPLVQNETDFHFVYGGG